MTRLCLVWIAFADQRKLYRIFSRKAYVFRQRTRKGKVDRLAGHNVFTRVNLPPNKRTLAFQPDSVFLKASNSIAK